MTDKELRKHLMESHKMGRYALNGSRSRLDKIHAAQHEGRGYIDPATESHTHFWLGK